jgi:hypothetical protein
MCVALSIFPIATKDISTALKEIVDAKGDGGAQKLVKNLAKGCCLPFLSVGNQIKRVNFWRVV